MCNFEIMDTIHEQVEKLIAHTGELRSRFSNVQEEFREGNLDGDALSQLNRAIHLMETDAAAFEKLLEA